MLKKDKLAIARKLYPNALTTIDTMNKVIDVMEGELNLDPSQVMMADSICSDDVNSIQFPVRYQEFLGPFRMGGLDGYPFTGISGMGALASHIPDEGGVFMYYGPHIGISKEGVVGEIQRFGQSYMTTCCGAANGAVGKLKKGKIHHLHVTELDYQMNTIEQLLLFQKDRILESPSAMMEATEVIYEATDKRIQELITATKFNCKYIVLLGTIIVNSDKDVGSFSAAKRFEVIDLATNERTNLLDLLR